MTDILYSPSYSTVYARLNIFIFCRHRGRRDPIAMPGIMQLQTSISSPIQYIVSKIDPSFCTPDHATSTCSTIRLQLEVALSRAFSLIGCLDEPKCGVFELFFYFLGPMLKVATETKSRLAKDVFPPLSHSRASDSSKLFYFVD